MHYRIQQTHDATDPCRMLYNNYIHHGDVDKRLHSGAINTSHVTGSYR